MSVGLPIQFERLNATPLTVDQVFDHLVAFEAYVAGPVSFPGQVCAVKGTSNTPTLYIINEDKTYSLVGGSGGRDFVANPIQGNELSGQDWETPIEGSRVFRIPVDGMFWAHTQHPEGITEGGFVVTSYEAGYGRVIWGEADPERPGILNHNTLRVGLISTGGNTLTLKEMDFQKQAEITTHIRQEKQAEDITEDDHGTRFENELLLPSKSGTLVVQDDLEFKANIFRERLEGSNTAASGLERGRDVDFVKIDTSVTVATVPGEVVFDHGDVVLTNDGHGRISVTLGGDVFDIYLGGEWLVPGGEVFNEIRGNITDLSGDYGNAFAAIRFYEWDEVLWDNEKIVEELRGRQPQEGSGVRIVTSLELDEMTGKYKGYLLAGDGSATDEVVEDIVMLSSGAARTGGTGAAAAWVPDLKNIGEMVIQSHGMGNLAWTADRSGFVRIVIQSGEIMMVPGAVGGEVRVYIDEEIAYYIGVSHSGIAHWNTVPIAKGQTIRLSSAGNFEAMGWFVPPVGIGQFAGDLTGLDTLFDKIEDIKNLVG